MADRNRNKKSKGRRRGKGTPEDLRELTNVAGAGLQFALGLASLFLGVNMIRVEQEEPEKKAIDDTQDAEATVISSKLNENNSK